MRDYYKILGLHYGATITEIKKAYRSLALECHPDKNNGSKEAEGKFKLLNEANQTLSDPEKKSIYDDEYLKQLDFIVKHIDKTLKLEEEGLPSYVTGVINTIKIKENLKQLSELYSKNKVIDRLMYKSASLNYFHYFLMERPVNETIEKEIKYFLNVIYKPIFESSGRWNIFPDTVLEEFIESFENDLMRRFNLIVTEPDQKAQLEAKSRLISSGFFTKVTNQEDFKIIFHEYIIIVLQYMEFRLSKVSKKESDPNLKFLNDLNRDFRINGTDQLDKVIIYQSLNSLFVPSDNPNYKKWLENMTSMKKLAFFDGLGESISFLSSEIDENKEKSIQEIVGAIYVIRKMYSLVRTEDERSKLENVEDKFHLNLEKYTRLLISKNDHNSFLDFLYVFRSTLKDEKRLNKKILELQKLCEKSVKKEGCYIATACYGSYSSPEVLILRKYRDEVLNEFFIGRAVVKLYYKFSPSVAKKLANSDSINYIVKKILNLLVDRIDSKK